MCMSFARAVLPLSRRHTAAHSQGLVMTFITKTPFTHVRCFSFGLPFPIKKRHSMGPPLGIHRVLAVMSGWVGTSSNVTRLLGAWPEVWPFTQGYTPVSTTSCRDHKPLILPEMEPGTVLCAIVFSRLSPQTQGVACFFFRDSFHWLIRWPVSACSSLEPAERAPGSAKRLVSNPLFAHKVAGSHSSTFA